MKSITPIITVVTLIAIVTLMIPALLVLPFSSDTASGKLVEKLQLEKRNQTVQKQTPGPAQEVAVYRQAKNTIEGVPLEEYVKGVVAAEMPAEFEPEALKAQALAARTYIVKQLMNKNSKGLPKGADVSDTETYQVYKNNEELKKIWGSDYNWKIKKISDAVEQTKGQILTYNSTPIEATFFSTSNGYTENSEDYWENKIPYLRSVESPWDKNSKKFNYEKVVSVTDFESKLGIKLKNNGKIGTVIARTPGKRVAMVAFDDKKLTGKQIRESLDLKSADFTWQRKGDQIIIYTKGFGHGVGMSQYGANGMAQEGKTYKDIITHYYQGVQISPSNTYLASK